MSKQAVIVDCIRTPMGRSKEGVFRHTRAETLSAHLMQSLIQRNPQIPLTDIEDIYWGCVQQTLEQGMNIARNAAVLAGLPFEIGAVTVNRLCGSSMQALHDAARSVSVGDADICLIGGVEHMGHVPMTHGIDMHPGLSKHAAKAAGMMGLTAEMLAKQNQISRDAQDQFALRSHQRAAQATEQKLFQREIVPTQGHNEQGALISLQEDEVIRRDASLEALASLKPVFDPASGTVTAGSSSALSDGASAMIVMSEEKAQQLGLPIRAKIRAMAVAGCEPSVMGIGPVPATRKALKRAGLSLHDIEVIELNEAFAAQALSCIQHFELMDSFDDKMNLWGGAIALGHPLGCSGARISTTLLNVMEHQDAQFGLATMCIGMGQGIATIFERVR
ncbi:acetyl-CoA C-acyltransferase FadA [Vibrio rhizosphaerae]|uniref:acetyl-CoA C-acyltransferase FadA n=1 Tax=Vibrio rhizosphaerae TaxID=398736 RepID=UPI00056F6CE4|nr:acetyl-CoA C-acyltransferase FadA [Vibrio rhizosphaerae]